MKHLEKLSELQELDLSDCWSLSDDVVQTLAALPALTDLRIAGCRGIEKLSTFKHIFQGPSITALDVSGCKLTDAAVKNLPLHLQKLNLSDCAKLKDASVKWLSQNLVNLQVLGLGLQSRLMTTASIHGLTKLTRLQQLDLSCCLAVTDETITLLCNFPDLQALRLRGCFEVSNECVKVLCTISTLTYLDLSMCQRITDAGALLLSTGLPRLRYLDLECDLQITVVGARAVARKPGLNHLNVDYCSVSEVEWKALGLSRWASSEWPKDFLFPSLEKML